MHHLSSKLQASYTSSTPPHPPVASPNLIANHFNTTHGNTTHGNTIESLTKSTISLTTNVNAAPVHPAVVSPKLSQPNTIPPNTVKNNHIPTTSNSDFIANVSDTNILRQLLLNNLQNSQTQYQHQLR